MYGIQNAQLVSDPGVLRELGDEPSEQVERALELAGFSGLERSANPYVNGARLFLRRRSHRRRARQGARDQEEENGATAVRAGDMHGPENAAGPAGCHAMIGSG